MYRDNCINYKALLAAHILHEIDEELLYDVGTLISFDAASADIPSYVAWVNEWRCIYNELSAQIKYVRTDRYTFINNGNKERTLAYLKKIANTLLNARAHARQVRYV